METIYVSVIVTAHSRTIENKLLQMEVPFGLEEGLLYRDAIEEWINRRPIPGQPEYEEFSPDPNTQLAAKLPGILGKRDPTLFGIFDYDSEAEASALEHRPYNWAWMEAV